MPFLVLDAIECTNLMTTCVLYFSARSAGQHCHDGTVGMAYENRSPFLSGGYAKIRLLPS
jgi:hypothetical protein